MLDLVRSKPDGMYVIAKDSSQPPTVKMYAVQDPDAFDDEELETSFQVVSDESGN